MRPPRVESGNDIEGSRGSKTEQVQQASRVQRQALSHCLLEAVDSCSLYLTKNPGRVRTLMNTSKARKEDPQIYLSNISVKGIKQSLSIFSCLYNYKLQAL